MFEEQVCVAVQRRAAVADVRGTLRSTRRTRSASLVSIFVVYTCMQRASSQFRNRIACMAMLKR